MDSKPNRLPGMLSAEKGDVPVAHVQMAEVSDEDLERAVGGWGTNPIVRNAVLRYRLDNPSAFHLVDPDEFPTESHN